jgi:hypothetical protein
VADVRLPSGEVIEDRRRAPDRRTGTERRGGRGRRGEDRAAARPGQLRALGWALIGSIVVLYLFFIALDAVDPDEARVTSLIVLGLGVLWLGHAWRRLWRGGYSSRSDRERRGF